MSRCNTSRWNISTPSVTRWLIVANTFALVTYNDSSHSWHLSCLWLFIRFSSPLCLGSTRHSNITWSFKLGPIRGWLCVLKYILEIAWQHGNPDNCQYLQEHVFACRSTVNLWSQCFTSNFSAPLLIVWQYPDNFIYEFNFFMMFGQILPIHLFDLPLYSWILTITFLLMASNMVIIGKKPCLNYPFIEWFTHIVIYWVTIAS